MSDLEPGEEQTLEAIFWGLALALRDSDDIDSESVAKTGEVKVQKFINEALNANDALDEVTHSWYLAGAKADIPQGRFGKDHLVATYERLDGPEAAGEDFVDRAPDEEPSTNVERYADFYREEFDLDRIWYTSTNHYLLEFYEERAPEQYNDLYVSVQQLRNLLRTTIGKLSDLVGDSSQTNLGQFGQDATVGAPNQYDEAAEIVSEIHLKLAADDDLQRTLPLYRAFTDVLEDAYLALSTMEVDRLDATHLQAFKKLSDFHYYQAWKLPALVISMETARGPREDKLRVEKAGELESHMEQVATELDGLRRTCSSAGLVPSIADYPASDVDDESLDDLIELYVDAAE